MTYYAIYKSGYAIFGIGETPDEATTDASAWLDDPEEPLEIVTEYGTTGALGETNGTLYLRPCTQRLYEEVQREGGDIIYLLTAEGLLDLIEDRDSVV